MDLHNTHNEVRTVNILNASQPAVATLPLWDADPEEVASIVAEMRPVIEAFAAREGQRIDELTSKGGDEARIPQRRRSRAAGIRSLEVELGQDAVVALLNESSPNRRRRLHAIHRRGQWAQTVAARRAGRAA
jgi:hypothetical protein